MSNFCDKFSLFARSLTPLFYFKENRCWQSLFSCESLWWTCFITNDVQRLVSTFWRWWFRPQQQRTWKTTEKIWRCRTAGIAGRRFNSNPKNIGSWPGNYFHTLSCYWKDPEWRKIGAVRIKKKRHWKAKNDLWNFVWSFQKKVIFASHCYWRWKVDLFRQSQVREIMGRTRLTINIITSMPYSWKESFAVYLVGSEGSCVL